MKNGNKGTPNTENQLLVDFLSKYPECGDSCSLNIQQPAVSFILFTSSILYSLYFKTNLQMAQLSTTMSQAHRATAFHFFTSNLYRMIEQWRKSFLCTCDHNPTVPFLILPCNNARTTWLLWVAVNLHLAIGIYTKSESGSSSFHDFYLSQSVKVFQYKSGTSAVSFLTDCLISKYDCNCFNLCE